jgi:c-di-GMP-binding flagellar brake protein YcgR
MTQSTGDSEQILQEAVVRNAGITLSLPSAGMDKHFKSRFLGAVQEGLWIEVVAGSEEPVKNLLAEQRPIDIAFQTPTRLLSFAAKCVRFDEAHRINSETTVAALLVEQPQQIKNVQRRNTYRVRVSTECKLSARIWIITEHVHLNDRPLAANEIKFELADISIGGIGMRMPAPTEGQKQPRLVKDQRIRVEMIFNDQKILFDGRYRPAPPTANLLTAGIVFKNLEADMEGRQKLATLTKIVSELQREEVRRARLGSA